MNVITGAKQRADRVFHSRQRFVARELARIFSTPVDPLDQSFDAIDIRYYVLDGKRPRPARSMQEHHAQAKDWFDSAGTGLWRVADTQFTGGRVSTIFVGLEAHLGALFEPPRFFESMVFLNRGTDDETAEERWKYATWEEAEAGHATLVAKYRGGKA